MICAEPSTEMCSVSARLSWTAVSGFRLDSQSSLFLEKSEVLDTSRNGGRISWIYKTDDPDSLMDILASYGYVPKKIPTDQVGFTVYRLHDPEGNPFFIAPKEEPDNE